MVVSHSVSAVGYHLSSLRMVAQLATAVNTFFHRKLQELHQAVAAVSKKISIAIRIGQNSINTIRAKPYSKGGWRMPPTPLPGIPTISLGDCLAANSYRSDRNSICSPCCTYVAPNQNTAAATPTAAVNPPRWGGGLGGSCTAPHDPTPTPRGLMNARAWADLRPCACDPPGSLLGPGGYPGKPLGRDA